MATASPRIVIVANVLPGRAVASGVQAHTLQLKARLVSQGYPVVLVAKGSDDSPDFVSVSPSRRVGDVRFVLRLFRLGPFRESVIHVQYPIYAIPWILRAHTALVSVLHGDNVSAIRSKRGRLTAWMYGQCERFALLRSARIVAVSDGIARAYMERWPELVDRIRTIRLEPDASLFHMGWRLGESSGERVASPIVLFVGRLRKDKRVDLLLEAFRRVRREVEDAQLWIVGDGTERARLEERAEALGLHGSVRFFGAVPREEVAKAMGLAAVLALPSAYESGPLVVAEARMCGARVVATDVGRVREFRDAFGGIEIVSADEPAFAQAIVAGIAEGPLSPPRVTGGDFSTAAFIHIYTELRPRLSRSKNPSERTNARDKPPR